MALRKLAWMVAVGGGVVVSAAWGDAPAQVSVEIDLGHAGAAIPADFLGISVEAQNLQPLADGTYLFRPDNAALLTLFKTLGIHNLRTGGYSADSPRIPNASHDAIDHLFTFAEAAGVKVLYTLRARVPAETNATTVKYIMDHYAADVVSFEIGNEGRMAGRAYGMYKETVEEAIETYRTAACAPGATFAGPNDVYGLSDLGWTPRLADDFADSGAVKLLTDHAYLFGDGQLVKDAAAARADLLDLKWLDTYEDTLLGIRPAESKPTLAFRLDETGNYYNGGAKDVSNTHAAALWGLDYLHWWASHGAAGINFHHGSNMGDPAAAKASWYASFWTGSGGYRVHPMGYAMKAFDAGSHGATVPVKIVNGGDVNLTAYAVRGEDKKVYLTLINKENGEGKQDITITPVLAGYVPTEKLVLEAHDNDLASTDTEQLGGSTIRDDGTWTGAWAVVKENTVTLPAGSATVLKMEMK